MGVIVNICAIVALVSIALIFLTIAALMMHTAYKHIFKGEKIEW